ncbi:Hemocyanin A-type, units Ode to Odg,Hemocyanin, beta-C chain unit D,Hemocyanin type 2 unit a,Hemocyanin [Argonauta hians]
MQHDSGPTGYQAISAYHGEPADCKAPDGSTVVCCLHGMPTFPLWHRLYLVQFEQAMAKHGSTHGIPYWDWTQPLSHLPVLVQHPLFIDPSGKKPKKNVFYSGAIEFKNKVTARVVDNTLFDATQGKVNSLLENMLMAFEQEEYCRFEVQFEVAHNPIHFLVGGRYPYSMSSLEYTSYDPLFFLHHSNVERLFTIWQELQKHRGHDSKINCGLNQLHTPMEPFGRESNPIELTRNNAKAENIFSYDHLGYSYDNITLNGMTIAELDKLLKERQAHPRVFANFRLSGIKTSANVHIKVCVRSKQLRKSDNCDNDAGEFFILGGVREMAWDFGYPYLHEITDTIKSLGLELDGDYFLKAEVTAINGTHLPSDIIPKPTVTYIPETGHQDPAMIEVDKAEIKIRKDVSDLTKEEEYNMRLAMERFMLDKSINGYQSLAEFHGLPAKCPRPDAFNRIACCEHGMATFPHWHRLVVLQFEDALADRGSTVGVPYWDWSKPVTHLPALVAEETYQDPFTLETRPNPFYHAPIDFLNAGIYTSRDVDPRLLKNPTKGDHCPLYDGLLLAYEQEDFCDFEVQFEVTHNFVHAWVGGKNEYSMSSLHFTSFDPLFWIHHSQVDRLWAIWQALQIHRGKPYKAYCANSEVHRPMKPFAFESPLNNNERTRAHSIPTDVYDYQAKLGYAYDSLSLGGMSIRELQQHIQDQKSRDRIFAGFLFQGIKTSASIDLYVVAGDNEYLAAPISILGGTKEMKWRFDRLFKQEITDSVKALGLDAFSEFSLRVEIKDINGTSLPSTMIAPPIVIYQPGKVAESVKFDENHRTRKAASTLTQYEMKELRIALEKYEADKTPTGYQQVAAFHGSTQWCPSPEAEQKYACCHHGMATFPHWHRLLTLNFENGLRRNGYKGGIPYWDWIHPINSLPELVAQEQYVDENGESHHNPFFSGSIDHIGKSTSRNPSPHLFAQPKFGDFTPLTNEILIALEQEDFCSFEVQFEIAHNHIHALVGGTDLYSMSSLEFTAYDPLFLLHHSNVDRIWAIWQALQKHRGNTYNSANCAIELLRKPMSPFSLSSEINIDAQTREHSVPFEVFDYAKNFHYEYDSLDVSGMSIAQLQTEINKRKSKDRIFVTFFLEGHKQSLLVEYFIRQDGSKDRHKAGEFYILGSENEMPWKLDRVYKSDITKQMDQLHLHYNDAYHIEYTLTDLNGKRVTSLGLEPAVIFTPGLGNYGEGRGWIEPVTSANRIRKNLEDLEVGEMESLRNSFKQMKRDGTYEKIAAFHGLPAQCPNQDGSKVFTCCLHGMANFLHWHRLYTVSVEHELLVRGSSVAVPYWDWLKPFEELPKLINEATFYNSRNLRIEPNPFFMGKISFENTETDRDPQTELFGNHYFYDKALFVFEQTDFCEFSTHLEVLHNSLHSWLGGRDPHSLSSLDYAAYDPVFFLHHSNIDRLWAIWQELQRYRKLPYNSAHCALGLLNQPMRPFSNKTANFNKVTYTNSRANDVFDYQNVFHYKYDSLDFNGLTVIQLENLLQEKKRQHDRVFVGILLHGIKASGDVRIYICTPTGSKQQQRNCGNYAGVFSVLGGETEMPWKFTNLFRYEITDSLAKLGLNHRSNFQISIEVLAVNGSRIDSNVFPRPTIIFVPKQGDYSSNEDKAMVRVNVVRKNINRLSLDEVDSLMYAMKQMHKDKSSDGFETIATFHALPPMCPNPTAKHRYACCVHGMATFPQWHRLFVVQFEQALQRHGSKVGVPYWDWTYPMSEIPSFLSMEKYVSPFTGIEMFNPFNHGHITHISEETMTRREINDQLFEKPELGKQTWLFNNIILALEQTDYCDFEIQFEIVHNAIHSWLGGSELYSMNQLHYAAYDPAFYTHHANVDRLWVIWQELQKFRGLPAYESNCAIELMSRPLKPFSFGAPYNLNPETYKYSTPSDVFQYKEHFHYEYDMLEMNGMSIVQLETYIRKAKQRDRVFAGFLLEGFGQSAYATFQVCDKKHICHDGSHFSVLGGSSEMSWAFDRLYLMEITDILDDMQLKFDSHFHIEHHILATNGTELPATLIPKASIIHIPAIRVEKERFIPHNKFRRNVMDLEQRDVQNIMSALTRMKQDDGDFGFQAVAGYHSAVLCPEPENAKYMCSRTGTATFPHWHRLYILHFEEALRRHGSNVAIPYWDWTDALKKLPSMLDDADYYDVWNDAVIENPFLRGYIKSEDTYTVRDIHPNLFDSTNLEIRKELVLDQLLLTLEQEDFCDFEVQFELLHYSVNFHIGTKQKYSMASLEYSAYDPFFYIHDSNMDRLWAIWQEIQEHRKLPFDKAYCALETMAIPMKPFNWDSNPSLDTRSLATPNMLFDYKRLGYKYDYLELFGLDVPQLEKEIVKIKRRDRVFVTFLLHGIQQSSSLELIVCNHVNKCFSVGYLYMLGAATEMPWHFDRAFKADTTKFLKLMSISLESLFDYTNKFHFEMKVRTRNGTLLPPNIQPKPSLVYVPAKGSVHHDRDHDHDDHVEGTLIRQNVNTLTSSEVENLRHALREVMADKSEIGYQKIAAFHGMPLSCTYDNGTAYACCQHGMVTFPHWHRLFVKQMEDALKAKGAKVGIPYWDWTLPFSHLPILVTEEKNNPFHHGVIDSVGKTTTRAPRHQLFERTSFFYDQIMFALEQTNFCDFEIQYEMSHNAIHSWVGGTSPYGMSTLHYTAYDPLFYLHHSNTDRIWAIWQALQKYRGLPYDSANCEIHKLRKPLEPFSSSKNPNKDTRTHSTGETSFDYHKLHYEYDSLTFHGMNIPQLESELTNLKHKDRVFVGFLLRAIRQSADVVFEVCRLDGECRSAGTFCILGGQHEMPWAFDRLFKYEVSNTLEQLRLQAHDHFNVNVTLRATDGTILPSSLIPPPSIMYLPAN